MADEDKLQTDGGQQSAAHPAPDPHKADPTPERYPGARRDDAVEYPDEKRSFDPPKASPKSQKGAGDGLLGPGGDPAEGKP
jgi:hypothetical protein